MTQPMAGPCDSPKLVTANRFPIVFPLIAHTVVRCAVLVKIAKGSYTGRL